MNKALIAAFGILVIAGLAFYFTQVNGVPGAADLTGAPANTQTSSPMRAGENMIVINAQRPGNSVVVSQVRLAAPGFVVVHEDRDGEPGAIIGFSSVLPAGDSSLVQVSLTKTVPDGTKLHAMLEFDIDKDGKFTETDSPVENKSGAIGGVFDITESASEMPPISI